MPSMEDHPSLAPQVENQQIQYRQDGPRSLSDSFTVLANASEVSRQSHPRTLFITILPRSTKGPRLRVNAGLQVREGRHGEERPTKSSDPTTLAGAGARRSPAAAQRRDTGTGERRSVFPTGRGCGGGGERAALAPSPSRPAADAGTGREVGASPRGAGAASAATAAAAPPPQPRLRDKPRQLQEQLAHVSPTRVGITQSSGQLSRLSLRPSRKTAGGKRSHLLLSSHLLLPTLPVSFGVTNVKFQLRI